MVNFSLFVTRTADNCAVASDGVAMVGATVNYSQKWGGRMVTPGSGGGNYSHSLEWTGTPTGVFSLWNSDKENPDETTDTDWTEDTTYTPTNPAGSASKFQQDKVAKSALWKRIKYINTSGVGVLKGRVSC